VVDAVPTLWFKPVQPLTWYFHKGGTQQKVCIDMNRTMTSNY